MKRLRLFLRLPAADRRLLVEAMLGLARAGILLRVLRFTRLSRSLGQHMAEAPNEEAAAHMAEARRIQWAVDTAARNLPWKPVCLPQAVAATRLLRRRGISSTLYLGIDPAAGYDAHAWVRVGPLIVTGGPRPDRFSVVSTFA